MILHLYNLCSHSHSFGLHLLTEQNGYLSFPLKLRDRASQSTKYTVVRKTGPVGEKGNGLKNVTIRQGLYRAINISFLLFLLSVMPIFKYASTLLSRHQRRHNIFVVCLL